MEKFVGFFRSVSYLFFTAALLWSYAYLVGQVDYGLDTNNNPTDIIDKDYYFFIAIVVFLVVNLVMSWFIKSLKKVKSVEGGTGIRNRSFRLDLIVWLKGLSGIMNLMMALIMFFIGLMNLSESRDAMTLGFYIYLGPVLLISWFVYLAVILGKKRTS